MPDIDLIPVGELEGSPAVRLVVPAQIDPSFLLRQFTAAWRPGTRVLWVEDAAWGDQRFDDSLSFLMSDPKMEDLIVWSERDAGQDAWSSSPMWNCVHLTTLMAKPLTMRAILEGLSAMPYIPRPVELVIDQPFRGNILPSMLDELSTRLDPEMGGWIYVQPSAKQSYVDAALSACSSASTRWGVRYWRPGYGRT